MHTVTKKLTSVILASLLVLLLIPVGLFAQAESVIMDEDELRATVLEGGEITLGNSISMYIPLEITKDTVIHLGDNQLNIFSVSGAEAPECSIILSGASLTVDGGNGGIYYSGTGSVFKLVGAADKATTLTINSGNYSAMCMYDYVNNEKSDCPQAAVKVVCDEGTVAPHVVIKGGSLMCASSSELGGSIEFKNPLLVGGDDCVIMGGSFYTDPSPYVPDGYITIGGFGYQVLQISTEMSDAFAAMLTEDGKLVFDRYKPLNSEELTYLVDAYWSFTEEHSAVFQSTTYDPEAATVYISRCDRDTGEVLETHKVQLEFRFDEELKTVVDSYIAALPQGEETEWGIEPYYYSVGDLALINYWLSCTGEDSDINSFISFSDEFKKYIDYKNFALDCRMGWCAPLNTGAAGIADFAINGTVYGNANLGVSADHILYVPSNTATDKDSLLAAAKARLTAYLGEGHGVQLSYFGTALDVAFRFSYDMDLMYGYIDPDMTLQEYIEQNAYIADAFDMYIGVDGVQTGDPCFAAVIDGRTYYLLIRPDSDKMVTPSFLNVDITTAVEVSTEAADVPLDTLLQVDTVTGNAYEALMEKLPVDEGHAYDIKLYSSTMKEYVTKLDNGNFAVRLPVPQDLKGKDVIVYYVDADGKVTDYPATPDGDGYISFVTDHFSVYTLAAKPTPAPAPHTHTPADNTWSSDKTNHWKACECGEKAHEESHTYGDWVIDAVKNTKVKTCSVCGYQLIEKTDDLSTDPQPNSPPTGETRHTVLWLVLVLGSAAVLVVLTVLNKKDRS